MAQSFPFKIEQLLIVDLKEETVIGTIESFNIEKFTLSSVFDFNSGDSLGTMVINKNEVRNIRKINEKFVTPNTDVKSASSYFNNMESISSPAELQIRRLLSNIKYIDKKDDAYDNAIKDLWANREIFIAVDDNLFVFNNGPIITVATSGQVYIFDMNMLGKCFDLSEIFGAYQPTKIVYNASWVVEQFKLRTNMILRSIFDVYAGLRKHVPNFEFKDLVTFTNRYLNLPQELYPQHTVNSDIRPLDGNQILNLAKIPIFLQYFKNIFLLETLHQGINQQSSVISNHYRKQTNDRTIAEELHAVEEADNELLLQ